MSKKEIVKDSKMPKELQDMYDEYDEVCDLINSETFQKMKERSENLAAFIHKNIAPDGDTKEGADVETTRFQKAMIIMRYNTMIAAISSMQAYEGALREHLNYDSYNWRKTQEA
jgi:hypothetical protein